jgi:hypothetical protein
MVEHSEGLIDELRAGADETTWRLTVILWRLLEYERVADPRGLGEGGYRWLPVLLRLTDVRSSSAQSIDGVLGRIEALAKSKIPRAIVRSTLSRDIDRAYEDAVHTIDALRGKRGDVTEHFRNYIGRPRTMHRDLVALRYFLGDENFAFLREYMWLSPEEEKFSRWDEFVLWFNRFSGGDMTV